MITWNHMVNLVFKNKTQGTPPTENNMADEDAITHPIVSEREIEPEEEEEEGVDLPTFVDPSASLEEVIALATAADQSVVITPTPPTPYDRLHTLIEADRFPPGQRAMFAAIDALKPELSPEDAVTGLEFALKLLHETLETALEEPSTIQQHQHVRAKLLAEYLALPDQVQVADIVMDALIQGIKDRVGSRWRVEAMEQREKRGIF